MYKGNKIGDFWNYTIHLIPVRGAMARLTSKPLVAPYEIEELKKKGRKTRKQEQFAGICGVYADIYFY